MLTQGELKRTSLYEDHRALKARMVPFGGWEMPVQYDGIIAEYEYTRRGCALFDISHMGEFIIEGSAESCGLDQIVTISLQGMPILSSRYGFILNDNGGVIDDLIVFRLGEEKWFIVVNASTAQKDASHIQSKLNSSAVFKDVSSSTGKLDLQGPLSREILKKFVPDIEKLSYFNFDYFNLLGERILISRTGYTGELGYEIFYPWEKMSGLWRAILKDSFVKPAGLGARDILRLEVGYSLYGHELEEDITPLEAGLSRFIDFDKDFLGRDALLKQKEKGVSRILVGFTAENRRSPRAGQNIFSMNGENIGVVTSGSFSPAVDRGIGVGFVQARYNLAGTVVYIGDEKNKIKADISGKIFYKKGSLKS
jgi:aminomethyltransferase